MSKLLYIAALLVISPVLYGTAMAQGQSKDVNAQEENKAASSGQTSQADDRVFSTKQVDKKASVKSRRDPGYPYWLKGRAKVVLRAIFRASGEVTDIKVIRVDMENPSVMERELMQQCVEAARKIKFKPAVKDGRPVSQYIQIEYNFMVPM